MVHERPLLGRDSRHRRIDVGVGVAEESRLRGVELYRAPSGVVGLRQRPVMLSEGDGRDRGSEDETIRRLKRIEHGVRSREGNVRTVDRVRHVVDEEAPLGPIDRIQKAFVIARRRADGDRADADGAARVREARGEEGSELGRVRRVREVDDVNERERGVRNVEGEGVARQCRGPLSPPPSLIGAPRKALPPDAPPASRPRRARDRDRGARPRRPRRRAVLPPVVPRGAHRCEGSCVRSGSCELRAGTRRCTCKG